MPVYKLIQTELPSPVSALTLVDQVGMPRFWANVWMTLSFGHLSYNTLRKKLDNIEGVYQFVDGRYGNGALDEALGRLDAHLIEEIATSYFVHIANRERATSSDDERWKDVWKFLEGIYLCQAKFGGAPRKVVSDIELRISRLSHLYANIKPRRPKNPERIRSLPPVVLEHLYAVLDPQSENNPFSNENTKWRVFATFTLLVNLGLRIGEALSLPVNSVKHEFDFKLGRDRFWLDVNEIPVATHDSRARPPGIKTVNSIRQIPVSSACARIIQAYTENYRGKPNHGFLLTSQENRPLSAESVYANFRKISMALPETVRTCLLERTGSKSIRPHDLRHTCAVVRMRQFLASGDSMDIACQKLRSFFGWSRNSDMPRRYAKAVFDDRLLEFWSDAFDDRVQYILSLRDATS